MYQMDFIILAKTCDGVLASFNRPLKPAPRRTSRVGRISRLVRNGSIVIRTFISRLIQLVTARSIVTLTEVTSM